MKEVPPRSLEHPLPAGMRDLLPEEAAVRRAIARTALSRFALFGYRLVLPPAFELAEVVERGLGPLAAGDVLRFIEPESGEVAMLRPDMTPQIARVVATRLSSHAPPLRLAYEGTVFRRRVGRAKKQRQVPQVGVELCGAEGAEGDLELLELAADALRACGLPRFTIDLGDAGVVRGLLDGVPEERAEPVMLALARKDEAMLDEHARDLPNGPALVALSRLSGGREALAEAAPLVRGTPAEPALARLLALFDAACERGLGPVLRADPGEVRGFAYYTGTLFSLYAPGPGDPVGAGGRYDALLSCFGAPLPAAGLGLDLDALATALREADRAPSLSDGVVVVGGPRDPRVSKLREAGVAAVAVAERGAAEAYARSWGFSCVWHERSLVALGTGRATPLPDGLDASLQAVVRVVRSETA